MNFIVRILVCSFVGWVVGEIYGMVLAPSLVKVSSSSPRLKPSLKS